MFRHLPRGMRRMLHGMRRPTHPPTSQVPLPPANGGDLSTADTSAAMSWCGSQDWQRRVLSKRGARMHTTSVERADRCAIAILDARGIVVTWHDYLPNARSHDRRVVYRHVSQFYLPEDVALQIPERRLSVAFSQGPDTQQGWRRRASGEIFWGITVIEAILLEDGGLLGYSHVTRPVRDPWGRAPAGALRTMQRPVQNIGLMA